MPTILIVDDEENVREIVSLMVQRLDYQVVTAASGSEAIRLLTRAAAGPRGRAPGAGPGAPRCSGAGPSHDVRPERARLRERPVSLP